MRSVHARATLVVAIAVAAIFVGPAVGTAHAQEAAVPTLTSANANAGGGDDISGGGCAARVSVQIQFDGAILISTRSTATGSYGAHLIIPVRAVPGSHRITVVCVSPSGAQVTTSTTVNVALPMTGSDTAAMLAVAFGLLLVGGAMMLGRRRTFV